MQLQGGGEDRERRGDVGPESHTAALGDAAGVRMWCLDILSTLVHWLL